MNDWPGLRGRRVLLVEDESLVSIMAEDMFIEAGCEVVLAMRLNEALELARASDFDVAVLDVNLGGSDTSYPVAALLAQAGKPFIFATGYGSEGIENAYRERPVVQKPYRADELLGAAAGALAGQAAG